MAHHQSLEQRLFADQQGRRGLDGLPKNNQPATLHVHKFLRLDPQAHDA
jgi:hypothetical protein